MRAALWLLALFAVAVATALIAGNNQAVVTVFWPPHRADVSFNLAMLVLLGVFLLLYVALRAMSAIFRLPIEARRWRAQQKERAMYGALMDALAHQLAGRYIRATKSAQNALQQEKSLARLADESGQAADKFTGYNAARASQLQSLAHLLVAESAQSLQNTALRDAHLQLALQSSAARHAQEIREGVQFRAARWALDDRDAAASLEALAQLPQGASRRTLALRLKLRATRQLRQTVWRWTLHACWASTARFHRRRRKVLSAGWGLKCWVTRMTPANLSKPGMHSTTASAPCLNWQCTLQPA